MGTLAKLFTNLAISRQLTQSTSVLAVSLQLSRHFNFFVKPKLGGGTQYRRTVHFPKDGKYTVQPLDNTHLAGRDPVSGRKVANGIGGGVKHK